RPREVLRAGEGGAGEWLRRRPAHPWRAPLALALALEFRGRFAHTRLRSDLADRACAEGRRHAGREPRAATPCEGLSCATSCALFRASRQGPGATLAARLLR